jgi:hypothetical protein
MSEEERLRKWLAYAEERKLDAESEGIMGAKNLSELYEIYLRSDPFIQLEIKEQLKLLLRQAH